MASPWEVEQRRVFTPMPRHRDTCAICGHDAREHQHPGLAAACPPPDMDESRRIFSRLQAQGAEVYGSAWLHANTVVVNIVRGCGLDPAADKQLALALTRIAFYICEQEGDATAEETASAAGENDTWETYKAIREVHAASMAIDAWREAQ